MTAQAQAQSHTPERTTINADEVEQFSRIAAEWWDPAGKFKPLHEINPVRLAYLREHIVRHFDRDEDSLRPLEGLSIADIGCGGGLICEPMARMGANVTGVDASDKNIKTAMTHAEQMGLDIDYIVGTSEQLAESLHGTKSEDSSPSPLAGEAVRPIARSSSAAQGQTFDIVLALEIVEHVDDVPLFVESCAALVKPGGILVMSTINRTMKSLAMAKFGAEYVLRLLPRGTHDWRKFLKPSELASHIEHHGFSIADCSGMVLNPLKWEWRIDANDVSQNYLMIAVQT